MKIIPIVVLFAAVLSGAALPALSTDSGLKTVQVVYESDARGYYLPCG